MRWTSVLLCAVCATVAFAQSPPTVRIAGATNYAPYSLVKLKAEGVDAKGGLLWRVYPSANVQRATNPRGVFEFAAPPGTYEVELLAITAGPGVSAADCHRAIFAGWLGPGRVGLIAGWPMSDGLGGVVDYYTS